MTNLKVGTILIAKEDFKDAITRGKKYPITKIDEEYIYFIDDKGLQGFVRINLVEENFTIKRYTLADLKERKIAVKLRNYAEYKRLCEAVGDKNSGVDTYGATDYYFGNDNFNGNSIVFLTRKELEGRILIPSIDLIDLEEKEETKEVINEAFYIQKLESEIARLKGENEELKEDNKLQRQLVREVKDKYIAMTEGYENKLKVLQETNATLREECDELHNQNELIIMKLCKESTTDLEKRERMAWELIIKSIYSGKEGVRTMDADQALDIADEFLAKSKEVGNGK